MLPRIFYWGPFPNNIHEEHKIVFTSGRPYSGGKHPELHFCFFQKCVYNTSRMPSTINHFVYINPFNTCNILMKQELLSLQIRRLRHRQVKQLTQIHPVRKPESQHRSSSLLAQRATPNRSSPSCSVSHSTQPPNLSLLICEMRIMTLLTSLETKIK